MLNIAAQSRRLMGSFSRLAAYLSKSTFAIISHSFCSMLVGSFMVTGMAIFVKS
jgi:hypothetical protein